MPTQFLQGARNPNVIAPAQQAIFAGAKIFSIAGFRQILVGDLVANDQIFVGRIPSNAILLPQSTIQHGALTGLTQLHVGFTTAGRANKLANALDCALAGTKNPLAALPVAELLNRVWQHAGFTSDPGTELDIILTAINANTAAAGLYINMLYVDGR